MSKRLPSTKVALRLLAEADTVETGVVISWMGLGDSPASDPTRSATFDEVLRLTAALFRDNPALFAQVAAGALAAPPTPAPERCNYCQRAYSVSLDDHLMNCGGVPLCVRALMREGHLGGCVGAAHAGPLSGPHAK